MSKERNHRTHLAQMLQASGVFGLRDQGLENDFIAGHANPTLNDLGIDSLAEMELCVVIENELGVSIVPDELGGLKTLEGLLRRIDQGRKGAT